MKGRTWKLEEDQNEDIRAIILHARYFFCLARSQTKSFSHCQVELSMWTQICLFTQVNHWREYISDSKWREKNNKTKKIDIYLVFFTCWECMPLWMITLNWKKEIHCCNISLNSWYNRMTALSLKGYFRYDRYLPPCFEFFTFFSY